MKSILLATAATLGVAAFGLQAQAADATRVSVVHTYPAPPLAGLSPDELRDYQRDQLERRQEAQREALRAHQKSERRVLGLDEDDD
jgi:hypothetical protein